MIKKRPNSHNLYFFIRRTFNTCPLPIEPPIPSVSTPPTDHKSLCFSLLDRLIRRNQFSSAQRVIHRIISQCSSVADAISAVDFATLRGMELDSCTYGAVIKKLVDSGETQLAKIVYNDGFVIKGNDSDPLVLNSMVVCCCSLGELEEAKTHFDKLIGMNWVPNRSTCNVLIWELCAKDRLLEAFDSFVVINDAGITLDFRCYNVLVDGLRILGYLDEALQVFDIMHDRGVPCTGHLWKSLVLSYCKRGLVEEAELLSTEMESQGFFLDKTIYTTLINGYCKKKKLKMAMRLFMKMMKKGCEPDSYIYNTLIHGFVNLGLPDKGWVLHNQMVERGIKPDTVTYHVMIRKYCKDKKSDCALMLLDSMYRNGIAPTVHIYTALITAMYNENKLMEVDELYKKMLDSGIVPDHVMFLTLLKMYPKGHELNLALMLLHAVSKVGCGLDPSSLDSDTCFEQRVEHLLGEIVKSNSDLAVVAFSIYIPALCAAGKSETALLCMDTMLSRGFQPLLSTYNSLIKCLFQEGLVNDVKSLFDLMQDRGMIPNSATYLILVNEHCKRGDLASAFSILDQMDERGLKPSVAIYDSIIGYLSREKRIYEAQDIFKRMLEAGVDPDEVIYVTMINAYSKSGRAVEACQLFDKMVEGGIQPSYRAYTALIHGLIKKNMTEKGCLYLDRMLEDGFEPNNVLYTSLINQFSKKSELEFAFRLVGLMETSQIEHDLVSSITLVSGVCKNIARIKGKWHFGHWKSERAREVLFHLLEQRSLVPRESQLRISMKSLEEIKFIAVKVMRKIVSTTFMPNLYLYNGAISVLCWANNIHDAYGHLEWMLRNGMYPNQVTFTILIGTHIRFRETDSAIWLFNQMNAYGCIPDRMVFNTLIIGLCQAGRLLDALSLTHTMYKRGFSPNKASYQHLLKCLCANRLSVHALRMCEDMLARDFIPSQFVLDLLLRLLVEEDKLHKAQVVRDMILDKRSILAEIAVERRFFFEELAERFLIESCHKQRELGLVS